jgi:hypothetical protein
MCSSQDSYLQPTCLITEINDAIAEKVCGGAITDPQTPGQNSSNTTNQGNAAITASPIAYNQLGLTPFFPNLPDTKLPRLGSLDVSNRTTPTPKGSITVTIPLPSTQITPGR